MNENRQFLNFQGGVANGSFEFWRSRDTPIDREFDKLQNDHHTTFARCPNRRSDPKNRNFQGAQITIAVRSNACKSLVRGPTASIFFSFDRGDRELHDERNQSSVG